MGAIEVRVHVDAPPERVFELASDLRKAPERISAIRRMEVLTDGPVRVGTRFRETRVLFRREATEEMEVTALEPPKRLAFGCESHGCRYDTEMSFSPASGGTDVGLRFEAVPLTRSMKVLAFLMAPLTRSIAKTCAQDLADLKAVAERERVAPAR